MDFSLTDDQKALAELAERILSDAATLERLKAIEASSERVDRAAWAKLAEAGLLGVAIPETYGGSGYGFVELCLLLERVGRTVAHVPVLQTLVCGAGAIAEFGDAAQKERFLPRVARGEALLSAALSEGETTERDPRTSARAAGDGVRLDGVKIGVPIAAQAEAVLVTARLDGGDVAVFLVDPRSRGVALAQQETTGWEGQYRMSLDGVVVPREAMLGSAGRGREVLDWLVDHATVGLCAIAAGVADKALRITATYASERKQFDKPIAAFQAVSQRLADSYIDNEAINLTMWQAATRLADRMPSAKEIATAKYWACEGGSRIGHAALHIHGGICIDVDYPIQRYFLWAKQIEFALGAATPQLVELGRRIAAEPTTSA
jgi:alkylation response protein AidB-like acyl-CoA dehydrogenase